MRYINVVRGLGIDIQNCVQGIQVELYQRGVGFPKGSITGSWNNDTYNLLDFLYKGDRSAWRNLGSDCAVMDDLKNPNGGSTRDIQRFPVDDVTAPAPVVSNASGPGTLPASATSAPGGSGPFSPSAPAAAPIASGTVFGIPIEYVGYGALALILYSTLGNRHA